MSRTWKITALTNGYILEVADYEPEVWNDGELRQVQKLQQHYAYETVEAALNELDNQVKLHDKTKQYGVGITEALNAAS